MKKRTEAVDIIIPVYNGYDDLQLCMPSVLKHTDLTKHRLILINDCSPDERIAPYLDSFAGKGHEDYQEIEGKKYPMDERVLIREILAEDAAKGK